MDTVVSAIHGTQVPCFYSYVGQASFFIMDDFGNAVRLDNNQFYARLMASTYNLSTSWSL